jgi:hypothetical protein
MMIGHDASSSTAPLLQQNCKLKTIDPTKSIPALQPDIEAWNAGDYS